MVVTVAGGYLTASAAATPGRGRDAASARLDGPTPRGRVARHSSCESSGWAVDRSARFGFHRLMAAPPPPPEPRPPLWQLAVTALTFYLGAQVGWLLVVPGTNVGVFWPPAGTALGLMLLWGPRTWPGLALGARRS